MIKCKLCGGSMEAIKVEAGEDYAYERYKCTNCGAKGSNTIDLVTMRETKVGALA